MKIKQLQNYLSVSSIEDYFLYSESYDIFVKLSAHKLMLDQVFASSL